jgi:TRAP-type C4-dicarboxylate transport system permease small subunit
MKLLDNWRVVARRAWSVRLGVIAAVLSGAEIVLPFFSDTVPRQLFALLSFVTVVAAVFARLVAQKEMR